MRDCREVVPNNYICCMADVHNEGVRYYDMSRIKSKDTKPEMLVRRYLHGNRLRYRLHDKSLPGKPDIVLPKYKTIIFIHGCFWHHHSSCKLGKIPSQNEKYWMKKINSNVQRDILHGQKLMQLDWNVITVWECELHNKKLAETLKNLLLSLKQNLHT